jgi:DNA-binding ferritin-like protein
MQKQELIDTLKAQYNRDVRKQLIKSILVHEKDGQLEALQPSYNVLNKIFSYVIAQLNWQLPTNSKEWDDTPLQVLVEVFPKIEKTKWFQEQHLDTPNTL